MERWTRLLKIF